MQFQKRINYSQSKHSGVQNSQILPNITQEQQTNRFQWEEPFSKAQETICGFFVVKMNKESPAEVLQYFEQIFVLQNNKISLEIRQALYEIVSLNQERTFRSTVKRSCYILINNWSAARYYQPIQQLIELFSKLSNNDSRLPPARQRLNQWLRNFLNSQDYQELKSFASKYINRDKQRWSNRYASYLLTIQSLDAKVTREQRDAAKVVSQNLKEQFNFDLAMYTARSQGAVASVRHGQNPTALGRNALRLIKKILAKRGTYNYTDLANLFILQTEGLVYKQVKYGLIKYLLLNLEKDAWIGMLETNLSNYIKSNYEDYNQKTCNRNLLLRTCNRVIEYLTTQDKGKPSLMFTLLLIQGRSFNLVILLLKIVLICKDSYVHLETCIAYLIHYYEDEPASNCKWLISFLETLKVTLTVYLENVRYNLVSIEPSQRKRQASPDSDNYRIFSQAKQQQVAVEKAPDNSGTRQRKTAFV